MKKVKAKLFIENFRHCKLMFEQSKENQKMASKLGKHKTVDQESRIQLLIQKLALLELSGLIETALDEIYCSVAKTSKEQELIERYIDSCYSFNKDNVIKCLKFCLGSTKFEEFKNKYTESEKRNFISKLGDIATYRNSFAHTCFDAAALSGGQRSIKQIQDDFIFLFVCFNRIINNIQNI